MNVTTMIVSGEEAARKVKVYGSIPEYKRTDEDDALLRVYRAIGKGKRVLDVGRAFRETGLHADGTPKLAIARANTTDVWFHPRVAWDSWDLRVGAGGFSPYGRWDARLTRMNFVLPAGTWENDQLTKLRLRSPVPHIPPACRPAGSIEAYHVLFDAQWQRYPVDPFLLRRVTGRLFTVEAEWELTELEASLLGAMRTT